MRIARDAEMARAYLDFYYKTHTNKNNYCFETAKKNVAEKRDNGFAFRLDQSYKYECLML